MNKRDPWVLVGMFIVAATAIVASFMTLMHLALWVGWDVRIAWLLPLCLDILAMTAGRVWLSGYATDQARHYARTVSMAALGTSILGNAIGHIVTMHNASPIKVALAIIVGSIPPAALAAVGHLATLATMQVGEPVAEVVAESIEASAEPEKPTRRGRPARKAEIALAHWESERAEGRTPTPKELARVADADDSMARRWVKRFSSEEMKGPAASLTLVTT
jgi:hypothetical protein